MNSKTTNDIVWLNARTSGIGSSNSESSTVGTSLANIIKNNIMVDCRALSQADKKECDQSARDYTAT